MVNISISFIVLFIFSSVINPNNLFAIDAVPPSKTFIKEPNLRYTKIISVLDGDTVEIEGGQKVRYLGIDTPELGQPFYEDAKNKNKELVLGKIVRLEICTDEPKDKYGRLLAYIYTEQVMINNELLAAGYARTLVIPPCGVERIEEFRFSQKKAMKKGIGLWSRKREKIITKDFIPASDTMKFIDERKAIYGRVVDVKKGEKAIFMDVRNTVKAGLTVVIFKQDKNNFEDDMIDPLTYYMGKEVVIFGKIKLYKGKTEVVIGSPSQIEIW